MDRGTREVGRECHFLSARSPKEGGTSAMGQVLFFFSSLLVQETLSRPWFPSQDLGTLWPISEHKPTLALCIHPCLSNPELSWTWL